MLRSSLKCTLSNPVLTTETIEGMAVKLSAEANMLQGCEYGTSEVYYKEGSAVLGCLCES